MNNPDPNSRKVVALVQARMSASRLPGKVLLDIGGKPMLARVVDRTRRSDIIDQVVVATSVEKDDDPIETYCNQQGIDCYRGSLHDVLDRCYQAAKYHTADIVVRITADCPIIDPEIINQTLAAFFGTGPQIITEETAAEPYYTKNSEPAWDFTANRLPPPWRRTFPIGLDTEVCTFNALEIAWREADQPHQREHVMPFLYENDQRFRVLLVNHEPDWGSLRWTVDTPQDLELIREIFNRFEGRDDFSWLEVLEIFKREPELSAINADVIHKHYQDVEKIDK
jgi:spore coat polysaccharide biosynthesis protein SpsF